MLTANHYLVTFFRWLQLFLVKHWNIRNPKLAQYKLPDAFSLLLNDAKTFHFMRWSLHVINGAVYNKTTNCRVPFNVHIRTGNYCSILNILTTISFKKKIDDYSSIFEQKLMASVQYYWNTQIRLLFNTKIRIFDYSYIHI